MHNVFLSGAARTPIGDLAGALSGVSAVRLGKIAAAESLKRSNIGADQIDEAIFGNVLSAGLGQNPARQVAMGAGVPPEVPSFTVNKVCGSGLKAIELGWQSVLLDRAQAVLAGGMESMSQAPYVLQAMRLGATLGDRTAVDTVICDGLTDAFTHYHMGSTAEIIAEEEGISREEQDRYACESHAKCCRAVGQGILSEEIVAVPIRVKKKRTVIDRDEPPRADTSLERLSRLRLAFQVDGTVTAGNASSINDGAASVILVAGNSPLADRLDPGRTVILKGVATCGRAAETMGLAPIQASKTLLARAGLGSEEIDLWEINEAFASSTLAVIRGLEIDPEKVNVHGGAIALGHPIGCTGARLVVTLLHQMKRQGARFGIAALCIGGGMGMAMLLENI